MNGLGDSLLSQGVPYSSALERLSSAVRLGKSVDQPVAISHPKPESHDVDANEKMTQSQVQDRRENAHWDVVGKDEIDRIEIFQERLAEAEKRKVYRYPY
ncbi:MAG: hypothetical protein P4M11_08525 [Candidatus Pacebacteria bacterium]|nr:hypothetical protein [Candidatus Paceibacterota bacterium]